MNFFGTGENDKKNEEKKVNLDGIDIFLNYKSDLHIEGNVNISTKNFKRANTKPKANIVEPKQKWHNEKYVRKKNDETKNQKLF